MENSDIDIVAIREARCLTQKDIAARFGVSQATVCRWENGGPLPLLALREYERLAGKLAGISANDNRRDGGLNTSGGSGDGSTASNGGLNKTAQDLPPSVAGQAAHKPCQPVNGRKGGCPSENQTGAVKA